MRHFSLALICTVTSLLAMGQQYLRGINFKPLNEKIIVLNQMGDTIQLPGLGGLNVPQFSNFDFNSDGYLDLLVFDKTGDFLLPLIFKPMAHGRYTYVREDKYIRNFPNDITGFVIPGDFNADGLPDLFYHDGELGLKCAVNLGKDSDSIYHFQKQAESLTYSYFEQGLGIRYPGKIEVDKGSIPFIGDMDGDGDLDVLSYLSNDWGVSFFKNTQIEKGLPKDTLVFDKTDECWGQFREQVLINDVYFEPSQFCQNWYRSFKKKHEGGSALLLVDMDNDQDLDLIMGNSGFDNLILLYNGKSDFGTAKDTIISSDTLFPSNTSLPARQKTFPTPHLVDYNGDGIKDLIVSINKSDVVIKSYKERNNIIQYLNIGSNSNPKFIYDSTRFLDNALFDVGGHAAPTFWDFDQDGDQDLIIASNGEYVEDNYSNDQLYFLENMGDEQQPVFQVVDSNFLELKGLGMSVSVPSFGDVNEDGLTDLLVGQSDGSIWYFENEGTAQQPSMKLKTQSFGNIQMLAAAAPVLFDVDGDGHLDLLVGNIRGNIAYYRSEGKTSEGNMEWVTDDFGGVKVNEYLPEFNTFASEGRSAPAVLSNERGDLVLISGSLQGEIHKFSVEESRFNSTFVSDSNFVFNPRFSRFDKGRFGRNTYTAVTDLNGDGTPDLVVGNSRGGITFFEGNQDSTLHLESNSIGNPNWYLYPNPTRGEVQIYSNFNGGQEISLLIYDTQGKEWMRRVLSPKQNKYTVDVSSLPNGIYFIGLKGTAQSMVYKKLIIQH